MMRFAYPIVHQGQFGGCVRYLSLPPHQAPGTPYKLAYPRTPHFQAVHAVVQNLVPKRVEQLAQGTLGEVYERADQAGVWQGVSLDLAYFLALVQCSRQCVLEACTALGDVWCTGELDGLGDTRSLHVVDQPGFAAMLEGFLAQAHDGHRLFLIPAANVSRSHYDACRAHQVQILSLVEFGPVLASALAAGRWPAPATALVGTRKLPRLVTTLFAPSPAHARPRVVWSPWCPPSGPIVSGRLRPSGCGAVLWPRPRHCAAPVHAHSQPAPDSVWGLRYGEDLVAPGGVTPQLAGGALCLGRGPDGGRRADGRDQGRAGPSVRD